MTEPTAAPTARVPAPRKVVQAENPWTLALSIVGGVAIVGGFVLMLVPATSDYGQTSSVDLVRVITGACIVSVGGTLVTCALLLAGIGWYVREQTKHLQR